jgi:ArsR family metal-binding transcriptional regulator
MPKIKSPIEILKLLNKSNCGECNETTCLAFASKVFKGQKALSECPHVGQEVLMRFEDEPRDLKPAEEDQERVFERLKERLCTTDLAAAAKRLDAPFKDGILTLKVCG